MIKTSQVVGVLSEYVGEVFTYSDLVLFMEAREMYVTNASMRGFCKRLNLHGVLNDVSVANRKAATDKKMYFTMTEKGLSEFQYYDARLKEHLKNKRESMNKNMLIAGGKRRKVIPNSLKWKGASMKGAPGTTVLMLSNVE